MQTIGSANSILLRLPPLENMTSVAPNERVHELLPGSEIRLVDFVGPQLVKSWQRMFDLRSRSDTNLRHGKVYI